MAGHSIIHDIAYEPADTANGLQAAAQPISQAEFERRRSHSLELAANLGYIVSIMLHLEPYRAMPLAGIEKLVLPSIASRQFRISEGLIPGVGTVAPIAAVMWASVSADVDKRISSAIERPIELKPADWRSGDIVWIVEAIGDHSAVTDLLQQLKETDLKDRTVRMRIRGEDGKFRVGRLEIQHDAAQA